MTPLEALIPIPDETLASQLWVLEVLEPVS